MEILQNEYKKSIFKLTLTLILTLILIYFIFKNINISDLSRTFKNISFTALILPLICYILSYLFRALRFYFMFDKILSFKKLFKIVCVHNFWNNILPLRLGELSYIYLLKKEEIKFTKSAFTLAVVRLLDLVIIFVFFSTSLFFTTLDNYFLNTFLIIFLIILVICVIFIIFFRKLVFKWIIQIHDFTESRIIKSFLGSVIEILENFGTLKSKKKVFYLFTVSFFIWFLVLLTDYFIVTALINIPFFIVVIGICFAMLTYILPVQGLMGFGTTEGAWALVLIFFSFTKEQALATGFAFHIFGLIFVLLLGMYGFLMRQRYTFNQ